MQRFFATPGQIAKDTILLTGEDVNHIRNVLRMKEGEELWVSDGERYEYHCRIREISAQEIVLDILYAQEPEYELPNRLYLFQGLPKGDKMELIIQKAVELGAAGIIPVAAARSVTRLDEKRAEKKCLRWNQIAESAAKQSRRMKVPKVFPVTDFRDALKQAEELDVVLIPYEKAEGIGAAKELIRGIRPGQSVGIFIGPEGGFEPGEVEAAERAGAKPVTLGRRILRTETAGLAVLSVLMFHLEGE